MTRCSLAVLILLTATPSRAQGSAVVAGCMVGSCQEGPSTYRYDDGTVLTATFVAGRAEGEGAFTFPTGDTRTGTLVAGLNDGPGVHTYADGATWTGTWRRGYGTEGTLRDVDGRTLVRGPFPGRRAAEQGFACVSGTCSTGNGTGVWSDSTRYTGGWRRGLRHGLGTTVALTAAGTFTDAGTYADGRLAGPGRREEADGSVYVGTFRAGMRDGTGALTLADSSVYAGQFRDDEPNGRGRITASNGTVYDGEVADGVASGAGVRTQADGSVYEGQFAGGQPGGEGTLRYADGSVYTGTWREGERHGEGTYTMPDGAAYSGTFADDWWAGEGTFRFASGATWTGTWAESAAVGEGPYADSTGTLLYTSRFSEMWTPGTPGDGTAVGCVRGDCVDGTGTFRWPDGFLHTGGFARGLRNGPGMSTNPGGTSFDATFRDGQVEGRGRIFYADGDAYDGDLTRDGRRVGQGRLRFADGTVYDGAFAEGDPNGAGVMTRTTGCHHTGTFATETGRTTIVSGSYACPDGTAYRGGWRSGDLHGDGVWTYANGVTWSGRFADGRGDGDGAWADAAGAIYARGPYSTEPRAGAAATTASVPVLGRVRVTTETGPGRRGVSVSAGDPALGERLFPRVP